MYCVNGHQNSGGQRYCGICGAPLGGDLGRLQQGLRAVPASPRAVQRARLPRWGWIATATVAAVGVTVAAILWLTNRGADADRWSAMPHTMGCQFETEVDRSDPQIRYVQPPDAGRAIQVSVDHGSGQQLVVAVRFAQRPELSRFAYAFAIRGTPGAKSVVTVISPMQGEGGTEWMALRMDQVGEDVEKDMDGAPGPRHHSANLLTSVSQDGNEFDFVVDLANQPDVLGEGVFKPAATVSANPQLGSAPPLTMTYSQLCRWNTAVGSDSGVTDSAPPVAPVPAQTPDSQPAPAPPPAAASRHPLPDADVHGFTAHSEAECLDIDPAVAMGRTADSLVVICQSTTGALYYRGYGLGNHLPLYIDGAHRSGDGFVAFNNGYEYTLSRTALVITRESGTVSNEPMMEYWSADR